MDCSVGLATALLHTLPHDLLVAILVACDTTHDLVSLQRVCREISARVEPALRLRNSVPPDARLPKGFSSWLQYLYWRDRRRMPPQKLAAAAFHSLIANADGNLRTCGADAHRRGYLGRGTAVFESEMPEPVPFPGIRERVISVAAHSMHSLALGSSGAVYSFGHGEFGKLGHGDEATVWLPRKIDALDGERIVEVSAGQQHNLVRSAKGHVYSFGSGFGGKLGHGDQSSRFVPERVRVLCDGADDVEATVSAVAAGSFHSLVVTSDGALFSFGHGLQLQLGHGVRQGELSPRRVEALSCVKVVAAAGGENHTLIIDEEGCVYSCGAGEARSASSSAWLGGWLGHGDFEEQRLPKQIAALTGIRVLAVAAGSRHSVVLADGGAVYTFGAGEGGKLGHGDARFQWLPTRVRALNGVKVASIAAGESHALCATREGEVYAWGSGALGLTPPQLTELHAADATSQVGSAGNYEWAYGESLLNRQAHLPQLVDLS